MKRKKVAIHTLGCKVNAYESDAMQQILEAEGYEIVPFAPGADVYLINTCTVTNIADRKSRQMLHRAKKMNPDAVVIAVGCYAQTAGEALQADEAVDLVIGNNRKKEIGEILERWERKHAGERLQMQETARKPEQTQMQETARKPEQTQMQETGQESQRLQMLEIVREPEHPQMKEAMRESEQPLRTQENMYVSCQTQEKVHRQETMTETEQMQDIREAQELPQQTVRDLERSQRMIQVFGQSPEKIQTQVPGHPSERARLQVSGQSSEKVQLQEPGQKAQQAGSAECSAVYLNDLTHEKTYERLSISRTAEHTRAYMKVQDGCNQFCSYCAIPYARGRVRSRELQDVTEEVERLAKAGYREIVLTGIHLSSWGVDLPGGDRLLQLLQAVHETEGIRRIRLGSLEPGIITEEFARTAAGLEKLCPHFHLSLQSGCDATLKRMNRRYTSQEYYEKCQLLREMFPNPALTTDVIVGFPQESREEFETTKAFLEKVKFYETHIFKYSRREGTRAAAMEGQIPEEVKTRRSHVLLALNEKNRQAYQRSFVGRHVEVLFEEKVEKDGVLCYQGHSREYLKVTVPGGGADLRGKICDCILQESDVE